jgi:hypothetical protein
MECGIRDDISGLFESLAEHYKFIFYILYFINLIFYFHKQ